MSVSRSAGNRDEEIQVVAQIYEGGCLCGQTRYRAGGEPNNVVNCHCRSCRAASGAAFVAWASFAKREFAFTGSAPVEHHSSARVVRSFCGRCGSPLTYEHQDEPDYVDVAVATLDDPGSLEPGSHIWVSHKLPWVKIADGLPQYDEWRGEKPASY